MAAAPPSVYHPRMRRVLPLFLCLTLLLGGCRGTRVNIMGFEVNRRIQATASTTTGPEPLSSEEKMGVIVVIGLAIAGVVAGVVAAN